MAAGRPRMFAVHLALVALSVLAMPAVAKASAAVTLAAGTVTIDVDGVAGTVLTVPRDTRLATDGLQLERKGATTYAYAHIRGELSPPHDFECPLCPDVAIESLDAWPLEPSDLYVRDGNRVFAAGEHIDVYLLADGPATLHLTFEQLQGAAHIQATTPIDAHLDYLPVRQCIADCASYGGGGMTRDVAAPGYAFAVGYSEAPNDGPEPRYSSVTLNSVAEACAYPGLGASTASPDPDDHPLGCDGTFDDASRYAGTLRVAGVATSMALISGGTAVHWPNLNPSGDVYLGFMAGERSPVSTTPGRWGGYGIWISGRVPR